MGVLVDDDIEDDVVEVVEEEREEREEGRVAGVGSKLMMTGSLLWKSEEHPFSAAKKTKMDLISKRRGFAI